MRVEESCSDHNIIKFKIGQDTNYDTEYNYNGRRYVVTDVNLKKFDNNLSRSVAMKFRRGQRGLENLDNILALQVKEENDIERAVNQFQEALILACNKSFKKRKATKKEKYKSVPWWTQELTLKRKRVNALRRREWCKNQYHEEKSQYQATIKREKINSWKQFCNLTSATNPWNAIYKIALNKAKRRQSLSTLQKTDGS
jgi:hypothetical protein